MLNLLKKLLANTPPPALPHDLQDTIVKSISAQAWSLKNWVLWLLAPVVICAIATGLIITQNTGELSKESYWLIQQDSFISLNQTLAFFPSWLWSNLTLLGDAGVSFLLLAFLLFSRPQAWAALIATAPIAGVLSYAGKHIIAMPRPAAVLDHDSFNIIGNVVAAHTSFPSGHSIAVFGAAIAVMATLYAKPKTVQIWTILIIAILCAEVLCLSRVAVGAHWMFDTVFGASIGWVAGLLGASIARSKQLWWRKWQYDGTSRYVLGFILAIWALAIANRAMNSPAVDVILWISAACGAFASIKILYPKFSNRSKIKQHD